MKKILVTGGAGFIGSNFANYLLENYTSYKLVILDALTYAGNLNNLQQKFKNNGRLAFWQGNINNGELMDTLMSEVDIVFHFAAESHVARSIYDNRLFYETDVLGTQSVMNAIVKYKKSIERVVHISTSEVYGTNQSEKITEDHPLMPHSPYASAKAGADRLVHSYIETYDVPAAIVRPFNNYGPYQHLEKLTPRFITSVLLDEPITVHGDGTASRDWLYVHDHCVALDKILHCDIAKIKGEVFNVASETELSIKDIYECLARIHGERDVKIEYISNRPGQVQRQAASAEKTRKVLGWKAMTDFETGLRKTYQWYKDNTEWWKNILWMRHVPIVGDNGKVELH